jgi:hypothetical protein
MVYEQRRPNMRPKKRKTKGNGADDNTNDDLSLPTSQPTTNPSSSAKNKENKKKPAPSPLKNVVNKNQNNQKQQHHHLPASPTIRSKPATPTPSDTKPIHGASKKGRGGGHNCPCKDSATTHQFNKRCLRVKHAGYCPSCNSVVSYKYGCHNHGWKGDKLGMRPWTEQQLAGPEWNPGDLEARVTERRKRHG